MSQTLDIGQRQTTILMNPPLGAVEHCAVQDYTSDSGIKSGEWDGEKGRHQIAGLCTRNIDLCTQHIPSAGVLYSHANIPKGTLSLELLLGSSSQAHVCSQPTQ